MSILGIMYHAILWPCVVNIFVPSVLMCSSNVEIDGGNFDVNPSVERCLYGRSTGQPLYAGAGSTQDMFCSLSNLL